MNAVLCTPARRRLSSCSVGGVAHRAEPGRYYLRFSLNDCLFPNAPLATAAGEHETLFSVPFYARMWRSQVHEAIVWFHRSFSRPYITVKWLKSSSFWGFETWPEDWLAVLGLWVCAGRSPDVDLKQTAVHINPVIFCSTLYSMCINTVLVSVYRRIVRRY